MPVFQMQPIPFQPRIFRKLGVSKAFRRNFANIFAGVLMAFLFAPNVSAGNRKDHPYRYSIVDMPVSLGLGTIRTPGFSATKTQWYWIMIQVQKPLPFQQMQCMMGVISGPIDLKDCSSEDPRLRADWTVWNEGHIIRNGSSTTHGDGKFTKENIFKFLGDFPVTAGNKYVVEVKFTKDGTPLNVANPHLIVVPVGEE